MHSKRVISYRWNKSPTRGYSLEIRFNLKHKELIRILKPSPDDTLMSRVSFSFLCIDVKLPRNLREANQPTSHRRTMWNATQREIPAGWYRARFAASTFAEGRLIKRAKDALEWRYRGVRFVSATRTINHDRV